MRAVVPRGSNPDFATLHPGYTQGSTGYTDGIALKAGYHWPSRVGGQGTAMT
jgi:hypothetical protein